MRSLPLVPEVEAQMSNKVSVWPMFHLQDCAVPVSRVPNEEYEPTFMRAMANIESGGVANAKFILEGLVSNGGDHSLRPLAAIYLRQLSENATELIAAAAFNPWEEMDFPETDGEGETNESTDGEKSDEGSEQNESTEDAKDDNGVSKSEQNESDQKQ
jgi:hypothetical protein